jgi:hypothetical protein
MQKAYSRINWKNEPSLDTPLGANNLNKMDGALDVIDNRVLSLSGYEGRVQASEKNAKTSETNAKTSETNAKQSELLAKEYAEHAFIGTPEGYEQIVDTVQKMDIKESADTTLLDSKAGGYKLLSMSGNSVQKTTTGKNLLDNEAKTTTSYGVTFTVNEDGSVKANGTSSGTAYITLVTKMPLKKGAKYIFSGCPSGGSNTKYSSAITIYGTSTKNIYDRGSSVEYTCDEDNVTYTYQIVVFNGTTVNNLTFYPMLRLATETDATYEPYVGGIPSPNPDFPQSIHNVGDCVEMMQGAYIDGGNFSKTSTSVCSKNPTPCSGGELLKIEVGDSATVQYLFFNESGYLSYANGYEANVPSGATKFFFNVLRSSGITPSTVGKISLTINGKYVVQIVESGKNLVKVDAKTTTTKGVTFTVKDDGSVVANGTPSEDVYLRLANFTLPIGEYTLSGCAEGGSWSTYRLYCDSATDLGKGTTLSVTEEKETTANILIKSGTTVSNLTFYPMIRYADITDGTYEPYTEKVATVLLNAPLCETDVMSNKEVVRKRASVVFDGSSDEVFALWYQSANYVSFKTNITNAKAVSSESEVGNVLCTHLTTTSHSNAYSGGNNSIAIMTNGVIGIGFNSELGITSVDTLKTWLQSNPITVEYELATPIVETLDSTSQIALNSLETFDSVTYINVDSRVQPKGINGEYGTSKVGARTLKNELKNDTLEIKYNELAVALVATERGV